MFDFAGDVVMAMRLVHTCLQNFKICNLATYHLKIDCLKSRNILQRALKLPNSVPQNQIYSSSKKQSLKQSITVSPILN
jgi:hypothetical protein